MNKNNFVVFIFGVAIGAATAQIYFKKYYEKITQEEIDSVKDAFSKRKIDFDSEKQNNECEAKNTDQKSKPDITEYTEKIHQYGYKDYSANSEKNNKNEKDDSMKHEPYVISPEEYGENTDYENLSLTYYSDGILVDDDDEVIENIEDTVGADFADHFGDYEDDSVFIRNDILKCDYEILKDHRPYGSVYRSGGIHD